MPDNEKVQELSGSDMAHWLKLKPEEKKLNTKLNHEFLRRMPVLAYDNHETNDDHGMQISGIAKDQEGNEYYMVKNSWGTSNKYEGIWYIQTFYPLQIMNIICSQKMPSKRSKRN